jgi:GNAT acetyltransferase-like protein
MNPDPKGVVAGYLSPEYGQSFRPAGRIITLPRSGLQLIEREIRPGVSDLIGLYPYSMCRDFAALETKEDRTALRATGAVAVSFVADPFVSGTVRTALANWAVCRRFKTQFVIDLAGDWRAARSRTVRRFVRRGAARQQTRTGPADPSQGAEFWRFYQNTIRRHDVSGIQRLSRAIITEQLGVPGGYMTASSIDGQATGMILSYVHASHVSAHLICFGDRHYAEYTGYVLIDAAAAHAEDLGCRWFNLGGPAGLKDDPEDGLYQFKRRWSRNTRETTLCGQVLNGPTYDQLCAEAECDPDTAFFPAYRQPGSPYEWCPRL